MQVGISKFYQLLSRFTTSILPFINCCVAEKVRYVLRALSNNFKMMKTISLLTRRFLLSSQDVRQMGTAAELARQRRSLEGRVAVVTASTDGSVKSFFKTICCRSFLLIDSCFILK